MTKTHKEIIIWLENIDLVMKMFKMQKILMVIKIDFFS